MEYNIKLEVYFEVMDADVYGGLGSVGYASAGINGNMGAYVIKNITGDSHYVTLQMERD